MTTLNCSKRFIASAVCPKCLKLDKIIMYQQEDDQCIECIACGFFQTKAQLEKLNGSIE